MVELSGEMKIMKFFICKTVAAVLLAITVSVASAQTSSDLPGYGNSGSGSTGSGSSSTGSSSGSGSGSIGSDTGMGQSLGSTAASDVDRFEGVAANDFVGINDSAPFVGRERPFETSSSTRTSNVRSTSTRSTSRTTSSRTSTSRTNIGRTSGTSNQTGVRSMTSTDFAFSPMEVGHREATFQYRLNRIPNLRSLPNQVQVKIENTTTGNVATLKGTVSSERDRKIAKQLLLLEPGIDKVDNHLVVAVNNPSPVYRQSQQYQPPVYQTPIIAPPKPAKVEWQEVDPVPILAPAEEFVNPTL